MRKALSCESSMIMISYNICWLVTLQGFILRQTNFCLVQIPFYFPNESNLLVNWKFLWKERAAGLGVITNPDDYFWIHHSDRNWHDRFCWWQNWNPWRKGRWLPQHYIVELLHHHADYIQMKTLSLGSRSSALLLHRAAPVISQRQSSRNAEIVWTFVSKRNYKNSCGQFVSAVSAVFGMRTRREWVKTDPLRPTFEQVWMTDLLRRFSKKHLSKHVWKLFRVDPPWGKRFPGSNLCVRRSKPSKLF